MLVSAVLDPSAFDEENFLDKSYRIHAEDLLTGIVDNGLLIFDSGGELKNAFIEQIESLSSNDGQYIQILLEELLKIEPKRFVACSPSLNDKSNDLLKLARCLKMDTKADAFIVSDHSLEILRSEQVDNESIVPLSKYRNSEFEKCRRRYYSGLGSIDTLPDLEVENMIIRTVRFSKCLQFYDRHIGQRTNTCHFYAGIEYILSLWHEHGFFVSDQDFGTVKIYTCSVDCILAEDTDFNKKKKKRKNKEQYEDIDREIIAPLEAEENSPWSVKILIKDDPDNIFHARYLESEHAVVRVDRGFRLFKQGRKFRQNLFTLNMTEEKLVGRYQNLTNAIV